MYSEVVNVKEQPTYRAVILLDYQFRREKGEQPVQCVSMQKSGLNYVQQEMKLTKSVRLRNIKLPLFHSSHMHTYNFLAKVEKDKFSLKIAQNVICNLDRPNPSKFLRKTWIIYLRFLLQVFQLRKRVASSSSSMNSTTIWREKEPSCQKLPKPWSTSSPRTSNMG